MIKDSYTTEKRIKEDITEEKVEKEKFILEEKEKFLLEEKDYLLIEQLEKLTEAINRLIMVSGIRR